MRALFRRRSSSSTVSSSQSPSIDADPPSTDADPPPSAPQSPGILSLTRFLLSESLLTGPTPAPNLALEPASPRPGEDCPICLTSLDDGCSRTPCLHVFHHKCLDAYFMASRREAGSQGARGKCPICRGAVHAPLPVKARATSGRCIIAGLTARRIPHFSNSDPPWQAD